MNANPIKAMVTMVTDHSHRVNTMLRLFVTRTVQITLLPNPHFLWASHLVICRCLDI